MPDIRRTEFTRLYDPEAEPVVAHLAVNTWPLCDTNYDFMDPGPGNWYGTGTWQEGETARQLPLCAECVRIAGLYGWHDEMAPQLPPGQ